MRLSQTIALSFSFLNAPIGQVFARKIRSLRCMNLKFIFPFFEFDEESWLISVYQRKNKSLRHTLFLSLQPSWSFSTGLLRHPSPSKHHVVCHSVICICSSRPVSGHLEWSKVESVSRSSNWFLTCSRKRTRWPVINSVFKCFRSKSFFFQSQHDSGSSKYSSWPIAFAQRLLEFQIIKMVFFDILQILTNWL